MNMMIDGREVLAEYYPEVHTSKGTVPSRLVVSFKGKFFAHAVFRREAGADRFGKRHGLNRELEFSDENFNSKVYIECEDGPFVRRVLGPEQARRNLLKILEDFNFLQINGNKCVMIKSPCEDIESGVDPDADEDSNVSEDVGPCDDPNWYVDLVKEKGALMLTLVDSIPAPEYGKKSSTPLTDRSIWQARILTLFASFIFCIGFGLMLWGMKLSVPFSQDFLHIFQTTIPFIVPAVIVTTLFFIICVWGRSRNSLFMLLFLSLLGIVLGFWGGALVRNADIQHEVSVVSKTTQNVSK